MFQNLKITFKMGSPVATMGYIFLDGILSSAIAKDILGDKYYNNGENIHGTKEDIDKWLGQILDKRQGVFCSSVGIGDNREFISSWSKRWDNKYDDMVKFNGKNKERVDIGSGYFKNYHMPLVVKSYKEVVFYAKGNKDEIERLLKTYIHFIGKKPSQGYGEIKSIIIEEIEEDYSLWKNNKPMRPIPRTECSEWIENQIKDGLDFNLTIQYFSTYPPYWRTDCMEMCLMPVI